MLNLLKIITEYICILWKLVYECFTRNNFRNFYNVSIISFLRWKKYKYLFCAIPLPDFERVWRVLVPLLYSHLIFHGLDQVDFTTYGLFLHYFWLAPQGIYQWLD